LEIINMGDLHQNWIRKTELIDQIVDNLRVRGENSEYIISYMKNIISGLQAVAPKPVKGYLDVTIHNMTPVKNK